MNLVGEFILYALVIAASSCAGRVLRDAKARGIPSRKAFTWAALQFVEWPLFFWLYHRVRPKRSIERS